MANYVKASLKFSLIQDKYNSKLQLFPSLMPIKKNTSGRSQMVQEVYLRTIYTAKTTLKTKISDFQILL